MLRFDYFAISSASFLVIPIHKPFGSHILNHARKKHYNAERGNGIKEAKDSISLRRSRKYKDNPNCGTQQDGWTIPVVAPNKYEMMKARRLRYHSWESEYLTQNLAK